tara:strand:+ start:2333 stop:2491 length:159 start_codon:yes stop_codon:yes gene_type:complete
MIFVLLNSHTNLTGKILFNKEKNELPKTLLYFNIYIYLFLRVPKKKYGIYFS